MALGLTSPWLVVLLAGVACALLGGALWFWRALARPGISTVLGRIAVVGLLDIVVLGLMLAVVNRSAGFYASWAELFGTEKLAGHVVALQRGGLGSTGHPDGSQVGQEGHDGSLTVFGRSPVSVPGARHGLGGRLVAVRMTGPLSGISASGYVYAPGLSLRPPGRHQRFPVIVVISDRLGKRAGAFSARQIADTAASQIAAGRLRPAFVVMLPASIAFGAGRSCLDVPGGPQAGTFFSQDLPQLIRSGYRASSNPAQWALAGDSTGAYCALQLTLTNSAVYSVAAAPPGHYLPPLGPGAASLPQPFADQDNLLYLLGHQPMQPVSVLLTGSALASQPFTALVRPPMSVVSAQRAGGSWSVAQVLDWIGHALSGKP